MQSEDLPHLKWENFKLKPPAEVKHRLLITIDLAKPRKLTSSRRINPPDPLVNAERGLKNNSL